MFVDVLHSLMESQISTTNLRNMCPFKSFSAPFRIFSIFLRKTAFENIQTSGQ